ncbi:OmpA family protein [Sorangium sp. So ce327]|jgi:outer membrane protein OmpA-like peptidoglycan-associated protein|uniref:OmpA family protein n=1 Tax=unclassified Sorangium TaxID=2621164 RepID=UPI003F61510F
MRHAPAVLLAASLLAPAAARADGPSPAPSPPRSAQARPPALEVTIDRSKVDVKGRQIEVKLSRAASKVRIKVLGQSGAVLAEEEKPFGGAAAGSPLAVTWSPSSDEPVARIEVYGHDTEGYWAGIAIIPWNVSIPHEEVQFETNSDVIRAPEVPKLEASLQKISEVVAKTSELGKITLFIVGHTDTVGGVEHNLTLSRKRARAIAAWFKGRGVKLPIAFEGLGESAPLVKTADQVDEPRNRRVDYILSVEPPRLPSGDASWKAL